MNPKIHLALCLAAFAARAAAGDADDAAREQAQRALNQEVLSKPFDPGDIDKARLYAEEAKKANVTPVAQPPTYWAPGWTCTNLVGYAYYRYADYQNCIYYHYYFGRYWP